MITTMTATEIVNKNRNLVDAEYCIENINKCTGILTITVNEKSPETIHLENIHDHNLKNILESVIDNIKARLDELNELAVKEANDEE